MDEELSSLDNSATILPHSSYGCHLDQTNDTDLTCTTIPLTSDVSIVCSVPEEINLSSALPIAIITSKQFGMSNGVVLDPDYPAREPTISSICTPFGKRFGTPFMDKHGTRTWR